MNEFRDAIAAARVWMPGVDAQDYHCGIDMADEILAMPEMQAIREWILAMGQGQPGQPALPKSVIEWVLS